MLRIAAIEMRRRQPALARTAPATDPVPVAGPGKLPYLTIVGCLISYFLAKHIVAKTTLDQFEYWILGAAAPAVLLGVNHFATRLDGREAEASDPLFVARCWFFSLTWFVIL